MSAKSQKFCLFKRSNGYYYIVFADNGHERWKSTGATTKPEALKAVSEFEELLKMQPKPVSFSSFKKDFLTYAKSAFAHRTVIIYEQSFKRLEAVVGERSLASLTPKHLDTYKTERLNANISPVTVNIEVRALKAAMNTAVRWRLLEVNPFAEVQQARVVEQQPAFFSKDGFGKLLATVTEQWLRELIVFAVSTGMRQAETLNLRWQDIDLGRKLIHIQSNPTFKTKQGKTRTIPMNEVVHAMLSSKAERSTSEYVFTRKGRRIGESYLTHSFKECRENAGLDERLHWHSLRHTHASWLVQNGVSLYEVQKLLGHSSSRVTEVYSHLEPDQMHETVNRLQIALN